VLDASLRDDCLDPSTYELHPVVIVTDNGPASSPPTSFGSSAPGPSSATCASATAPQTKRVVERFNVSLKYEHHYREDITDAMVLARTRSSATGDLQ
jgi:putative transposase